MLYRGIHCWVHLYPVDTMYGLVIEQLSQGIKVVVKKYEHEQGGKKHTNKQTNKFQYVTVKILDCSNVIRVKLHAFHVPCVVRVHDSTFNVRMTDTE